MDNNFFQRIAQERIARAIQADVNFFQWIAQAVEWLMNGIQMDIHSKTLNCKKPFSCERSHLFTQASFYLGFYR